MEKKIHKNHSSDPLFQPSCTDEPFNHWREVGICAIKDLYLNNILTFQQIQDRYELPSSHLF